MENICLKYINGPEVSYLFGEGYELVKCGKVDSFFNNELNNLHLGIKNILSNCYIFHLKTSKGEYYLFKSIKEETAFLSRVPNGDISANLSPLHVEFLKNIGEVIYFWGFPKNSEPFGNLAFMFLNKDTRGLGDLYQVYKEQCEAYSKKINSFVDSLVIFAEETEGCLFLYDNQENIYMYAFENDDSYLTLMDGYPPETLYTINGVKTLSDWLIKFSKFMI